MKTLEKLLYERPYSIGAFAFVGLLAGLGMNVHEAVGFAVLVLFIVLLAYFAFKPENDKSPRDSGG